MEPTDASGAKFATNASGATWWPKLEPMLTAIHVAKISFSQDYFKLLSVRKLIQVEMLYPGSVVPLAMFIFGSTGHNDPCIVIWISVMII